MNLKSVLRSVTDHLGGNHLENTAQVKQAVILPILRALDWDDSDPAIFKPEFSVSRNSFDYALLDHGAPKVFVVVQKTGAPDGDNKRQQLRIAASQKFRLSS